MLQVVKYFTLSEVKKDIISVPLPWFIMPTAGEDIHIGALDTDNNLKYRVLIGEDLQATVFVHCLKAQKSSLEMKNLRVFLNEVLEQKICTGLPDRDLQSYAPMPDASSSFYRQVINITTPSGPSHTSTVRAADCNIFLQSSTSNVTCTSCHELRRRLQAHQKREANNLSKPLHQNAPLCSAAKEKLANALKQSRHIQTELKMKLDKMKLELENEAIGVPQRLHEDLKQAIEEGEITQPMAKLFWKEQLAAFKTKERGMRWHPMMIRLAILLRCQSPAAYATLRDTGVLKLPGESTLRDYTNAVQPQEGFNPSVMEEIRKTTEDLPDNKRFVVLLHDEMAIKHDLVFDRRSGEIVGFINPQKWVENEDNLATHVLVFMVIGINTSLKTSLGFFGARTATADALYPLLWQAGIS